MSLIKIRKRSLIIETQFHDGGPVVDVPLKLAAACAVIENPYAGRYEPDLMPFMAELRSLGTLLAQELVDTLGKDNVEVYSKAAIVGVNGEMEHGAVWHEAGGWPLCPLAKRLPALAIGSWCHCITSMPAMFEVISTAWK
jgi:hypothetical protein